LDSTKVIMGATAVVALALTFLVGQSMGEGAAESRNEKLMAEKLGALTGERNQLKADATNYKREYEEAKATVVALREKMQGQAKTTAEDQADLRLFRRIAKLDDAQQRGLHVEKVSMSKNFETGEVALDVLLIQSKGRNRAMGSVGARIIPDAGKPIVLTDANAENAPDFNLRFFQNIHIPVPEFSGHADELEIVVKPVGKQHESFTELIPWADIERLR